MVFVRYTDNEYKKEIREQLYCCKEFDPKTTGEEIFNLLNEQILKHGLSREWCTPACTDGAAAMVGRQNGLTARLKTTNCSIKWAQCIIHREALASKQLNEDLNYVLEIAVKTVNLIKSRL
jgi:hypothetical protein